MPCARGGETAELNPVQNENRISVLGRKLRAINRLCQTSLFEKPGFHSERGLGSRSEARDGVDLPHVTGRGEILSAIKPWSLGTTGWSRSPQFGRRRGTWHQKTASSRTYRGLDKALSPAKN